jgi:TetR/AcrR family transcriptional regulator, transcriptional repressor for nem operon
MSVFRVSEGMITELAYQEHNVRKGEQTRQEIIRRAAPIFNQKGYDGAALSDLMRATGLKKGGIYRHFESKQELAAEAFDYAWTVAIDARFEGTEEIPNTVDRLKQIVRNFKDRRAGLVPGGCPLLNTAIDCDDGNPKLRAKARLALGSWLDRLQSIAEEGQRRGEIASHVDSTELATLIASTLEGSLMVSRLQRKSEPLDLACNHLEEYLEAKARARKENRVGEIMSDQETPSQPDFRERAKANDVAVARLIGFEVKEIADGQATVVLSTGPQHANPMGTLHGGILCDIADAAMGIAFASTLAPEESFTTVELKINFFRPVWQAQLTAEGTVVQRGRTMGYVECTITDEQDRLVAKATSTCMVLRGPKAAGR